jgi:enamine deaminase RidA (YjgF/YER057c/UK114 family)
MQIWRGAPYEYSRSSKGLVFTAGACPLDADGAVVAAGDLVGQAERTVENLLLALTDAGVGPDSLLKTTIHVVAEARSDLALVWAVVSERLGRVPSTLLGVSFLGYPEQLVEIEAVANANRAASDDHTRALE